jgi:hypothetical protein
LLHTAEPTKVEEGIYDMLLASLSRQQIRKLEIFSYLWTLNPGQVRFLTENEELKDLEFHGVNFLGDACEAFARIPRCLERLEFAKCMLNDVQRLFEAIGANECGPTAIVMRDCGLEQSGVRDIDFTNVLVPLLKIPTNKKLDFNNDVNEFTGQNDFPAIKAAFESNKGLEELVVRHVLHIKRSVDLKLLFEGIAAAPELRNLEIYLWEDGRWVDVVWDDRWEDDGVISNQGACELFVRALTDSKNKSLEKVRCFDFRGYNEERHFDEEEEICKKIWKQEVLPILNFNTERRLFRENANSRSEDEQLFQALLLAEETDNNHFRFWLVCNYVGRLPRGESKQA